MRRARGLSRSRRAPLTPLCSAGTRFRPLSFEVPKPLFPVAGVPMVQHHVEACAKVREGLGPGPWNQGPSAIPFLSFLLPSCVPPQVPGMKEILLMGFYQPNEALSRFLVSAQQEFKIPIRWAAALSPLGHPRWHSLAQPLTCLPQPGSPHSALWHWAGGLWPTLHRHSLVPPLVLPPLLCLGPCPGWFLPQRCL